MKNLDNFSIEDIVSYTIERIFFNEKKIFDNFVESKTVKSLMSNSRKSKKYNTLYFFHTEKGIYFTFLEETYCIFYGASIQYSTNDIGFYNYKIYKSSSRSKIKFKSVSLEDFSFYCKLHSKLDDTYSII